MASKTRSSQASAAPGRHGEGEIPFFDSSKKTAKNEPIKPPAHAMERIPGYEGLLSSASDSNVPPPNANLPPLSPPSYQDATNGWFAKEMESSAMLTEPEARKLLIDKANSSCCWGVDAAKNMQIKRLTKSTAVHYELKTFLESRSLGWAAKPYRGQPIDGRQNGAAPLPWEIEVPEPDTFLDIVYEKEVPHTASVRTCHGCQGAAKVQCSACRGWGCNRCRQCKGSGVSGTNESLIQCKACNGNGKFQCPVCHGAARVGCVTCDCSGKVVCFVLMTVAFQTRRKDFTIGNLDLPDNLIRDASGRVLFSETQPLINPIQSFPDEQMNSQSVRAIQEHRRLAQTGRIWMQNHVIRGVPVFQCDCQWKDEEFQYFVYGDNRRVYAEDYPQKACPKCVLL